MNTPLRKTGVDAEGKTLYTGDAHSLYPNRKARRRVIQKRERDPLGYVQVHSHATGHFLYKTVVQRVWNKKKERTVTIVHSIDQ